MDRFGYATARNHKARHAVFAKVFGRLKERCFQAGVSDQLSTGTYGQISNCFLRQVKCAGKALGPLLEMKRI